MSRKNDARGSISRVLSSPAKFPWWGDVRPFLYATDCSAALATNPGDRPEPGLCAAPIRSCSRWGLPCRFRYRSRGALLPHPFTLAGPEGLSGLLSVALSLGSPPPGITRHRVSVEPGLSSRACAPAAAQPSGGDRSSGKAQEFKRPATLPQRQPHLPTVAAPPARPATPRCHRPRPRCATASSAGPMRSRRGDSRTRYG
jgi:hypothetical protein